MFFGDGGHDGGSGCDGLIEHYDWILDGKDHPDRSCSPGFRTGTGVALEPEHRAADRELRDGDVPGVVSSRYNSTASNAAP